MGKDDLQDRLDKIKPVAADMNPATPEPVVRGTYLIEVIASEKQLEHLRAHMRIIKIRFNIKETA